VTRQQHQVLRVVAVTTAFVVATPFMLSMALMSEPIVDEKSPASVVIELDTRALSDDWIGAHRLFSYVTKARTVLPELWAEASSTDREAFIAFWQPQFRTGWERTRGAELREARWALDEVRLSNGRALVEQRTTDNGREVVLRYWLQKLTTGWRIVDRTYVIDGLEHSGTPLIRMIRQKITAQIGRIPTLAEFVANAPSWTGRVRAKTFRIR
jgi:hypothetical protein